MARPTDRDRIVWLLQEEGVLSNRRVQTTLNLADEKYSKIRQLLLDDGVIQKRSGQGGGIQLTEKGAKEKALPESVSSVSSEKDLYAPFVKMLSDEIEENEEVATVIDTSALRKRGKWSNPDITKIALHRFPILRTHQIVLTTYELKQWARSSVESVFEAASQQRFAHKSWVVLEWAKDQEVVGLENLKAACSRFGIGLLTLHPYYKSFYSSVALEAELHSPPAQHVEDYLSYVTTRMPSANDKIEKLWQGET